MTTEQPTLAVLDTNIVLDLFLFQDPRTDSLRQSLASGQLGWIATQHMRNELERVLTYSHIVAKLEFYNKSSSDILQQFDQLAQITGQPLSKAPYACKDTDDQVFIDLAHTVAQQHGGSTVALMSKDKAVLSMRKRLANLSIHVSSMPKAAP
jgi:predicted nucleic acid-binding protein